ncbi:MAG: YkgJ family cysteine cluster protein [Chthonomonadales bacterium]
MQIPLSRQIKLVESQMDLTPCNGCDKCGSRCSFGVPMTQSEYEVIVDFLSDEVVGRQVSRVEQQNKQLDLGDEISVAMCRFRDMENGNCAVYSARPLICRLLGHVKWMPCPIEKVEKTVNTSDALELMRLYAEEPRRTYEEWASSKT